MLEDSAFTPGHEHRDVADQHVSTDRVEGDVARLQHCSERAAWAAQECLRAGDELGHREWLHEIIVGARIETRDPILDRVTRRQDENRHPIVTGAQLTKQAKAIAIR